MYELRVKEHFDAAHYIKDYPGKCSRTHGHRWEVEVVYSGRVLDNLNMLVDFSKVKAVLKDLLDAKLDHYMLNDVLDEEHVTAEFLAKWIYNKLSDVEFLGPKCLGLVEVTVWESPECFVTYRPEVG